MTQAKRGAGDVNLRVCLGTLVVEPFNGNLPGTVCQCRFIVLGGGAEKHARQLRGNIVRGGGTPAGGRSLGRPVRGATRGDSVL